MSHFPCYDRTYNQKAGCRTAFRALCASLLCLFFLSGTLTLLNTARFQQERLAAGLAPHVLRFHILANSDSPADQSLKLDVRDLLLARIQKDLPSPTREELLAYIQANRQNLTETAERYMASRGFPYSAQIRTERCYFSTRACKNVTFPCGFYDSIRILLGEGRGHNWWCVLYPPLSFSGSGSWEETHQSFPLISEEDCQWMTGNRSLVFGDCPPENKNAALKGGDQSTVTVCVKSKLWESITALPFLPSHWD